MGIDNESRQCIVFFSVNIVFNDSEKVESGEDWISQVDVVVEIQRLVIVSVDRVCCCDDTAPSLETCDNASLRNGNSLLLHGFVNGRPVLVIHLVELVDQADTFIS